MRDRNGDGDGEREMECKRLDIMHIGSFEFMLCELTTMTTLATKDIPVFSHITYCNGFRFSMRFLQSSVSSVLIAENLFHIIQSAADDEPSLFCLVASHLVL